MAGRGLLIGATYLKVHSTASNLAVKWGGLGCLIGRAKGGANTKFHAITDANGRPLASRITVSVSAMSIAPDRSR